MFCCLWKLSWNCLLKCKQLCYGQRKRWWRFLDRLQPTRIKQWSSNQFCHTLFTKFLLKPNGLPKNAFLHQQSTNHVISFYDLLVYTVPKKKNLDTLLYWNSFFHNLKIFSFSCLKKSSNWLINRYPVFKKFLLTFFQLRIILWINSFLQNR